MGLGTLIGKGLGLAEEVANASKVGKVTSKVDKGPKLPLDLTSAPLKSKKELNDIAERIARQQLGEHVTSEGETKNLAGRSAKENKRIQDTVYNLERSRQIDPTQEVTGNVGDINQAVIGDSTISDYYLLDANGIPINSKQEGGPRYGLGKKDNPNPPFWASNLAGARPLQNKVNKLSQLYDTDQIMGHHLAMGPTANNFAMHFADANMKAINNSDISPESINAFNQVIQEKHPDFPGIHKPEESMLAMKNDSEMRKYFNNRMKVPSITQPLGLPNGLDIQWAISEPDLRNMEIAMSGHSVGRLKPGAELIEGADHGTYTHKIPGEFLGHAPEIAPWEIAYPDADMYLRSVYEPKDISATLQKVAPHQVVNENYLNQLNEYYNRLREIRGFKKGGEANLEDSYKLADMIHTEPSQGGLNYRDYPNPYGLRAYKKDDGTYGGEMLPKYEGWLGKQKGEGKERGHIMTEYSIDDEKGSYPTLVPTLNEEDLVSLRQGKLTPSIIKKATAWRDSQEAKGESAFKNPEGFARGGPSRKKDGSIPSYNEGDTNPLYPITHGLAPMLYGAAKGTLGSTLGIPGDINELLKSHVVPHTPQSVQNVLQSMPEVFPTSEQVNAKLPNASKMLGMDKNAQGSENYGDIMGQNIVAPIGGPQLLGKAVRATRGLPVGMSIKDVSKPEVPFVSTLNKTVDNHKMNAMPGPQWSAWLKSNAPKSARKEADATKLDDWLATQGKVTKEDIKDYTDANRPEIKVVTRGAPTKLKNEDYARLKELSMRNDREGLNPNDYEDLIRLENIRDQHSPNVLRGQQRIQEQSAQQAQARGDNATASMRFNLAEHLGNRADAIEFNTSGSGGTKFGNWQLPDGENYKETTLAIPLSKANLEKGLPEGYKIKEDIKDGQVGYRPSTPSTLGDFYNTREEAQKELERFASNVTNANIKESAHQAPSAHAYGNEESDVNRVAHIRTNERPTSDDKRALFLEELQSDWAQQGYQARKDAIEAKAKAFGITKEEASKLVPQDAGFQKLTPVVGGDEPFPYEGKKGWNFIDNRGNMYTGFGDTLKEAEKDLRTMVFKGTSHVPEGPYVTDTKDWTALALKHALKQAVDEGHDYLAWTNGKQQARRYDLSQHIDRVDHDMNEDGTYNLSAIKNGQEVFSQEDIPAEQLAEHVGKDVADKIIKGEGKGKPPVYELDTHGARARFNSPEEAHYFAQTKGILPDSYTVNPVQDGYRNWKSLSGLDLQVGGEGMKGFYDQIVPQTMNDILKQIGSTERTKTVDFKPSNMTDEQWKSHLSELENDGEYTPPHLQQGVEITPELRDKVLNEGLPHFHHGGEVAITKTKHVKIKPIDLEMAFKLSKFKE
jgi:hypothetical protein